MRGELQALTASRSATFSFDMLCGTCSEFSFAVRYLHQEFLHLNDGLHDNNDDRRRAMWRARAHSDRFYCCRYYSMPGPLRGSCLVAAADLVHLIKSPFLLTSCKDVRFLIMNETYQFILGCYDCRDQYTIILCTLS